MQKLFFTIYLGVRVLDIISTYLNMALTNAWESIEAAPISYLGIKYFGFRGFVIMNFVFSIAIFWILSRYKLGRYALIGFVPINTVVVIINFVTYFMALSILKTTI